MDNFGGAVRTIVSFVVTGFEETTTDEDDGVCGGSVEEDDGSQVKPI